MVELGGCHRRQIHESLLPPALLCGLLVLLCTRDCSALSDFSDYLTKLLRNHTVYACDGDHLSLQCPRHSTISIQSAFYGRRLQTYHMCPTLEPEAMEKGSVDCMAETTLQKVLDECQNLRACQVPVNSRVFGPDPCPGTAKYLLVSFKCKPAEYKTRSVCENNELKLHCIESRYINIYSAVYGQLSEEKNNCSTPADCAPQFDCWSHSALQVLSRKCYGKQRCKIPVNDQHFGNPCLPGVKKYLTVTYACVPKVILLALDPDMSIINPTSEPTDVEIDINPRESRVPVNDGIILSSFLATCAYIKEHPELTALLFISSVCIGLILTLCALVVRLSSATDFQTRHQMRNRFSKECADARDSSREDEDSSENSSEDSSDEMADLCKSSHCVHFSMDPADLVERIDRREQIMQEICMHSGGDMPAARHWQAYY
ncbi:protein eva-1 homolog C [Ambystoma mexicanum]|uniref:protein eva-1 homolog C n=1 Tax=Ambystoma mexicanum TaxID=8296 RepID=UPI0037E7FC2C